jgi:hypothetical protein
MAQQSARRGRKNQMYSSCLEHAFMIWFRSANSHTGPQLHRCTRGRTDGSIRLRANLLQKPLALGGASTDEYAPQSSEAGSQLRPGGRAAKIIQDALGIESDDVVNYSFPKKWPSDREQRARIIGERLRTEASYLA